MEKPESYKLSEEEIIKLMEKRQVEAELGIAKKYEQVNYFEEDIALADSEDNNTYDDDDDDFFMNNQDDDHDDSDKIQIMNDSFNRDGGYVAHGGGIQVENLDIPPW